MNKISSINNSDIAICAKNNTGSKDNDAFSKIFDSVIKTSTPNKEQSLNSENKKESSKSLLVKNDNSKTSEKTQKTSESDPDNYESKQNSSITPSAPATLKRNPTQKITDEDESNNETNVQLLINSIFNLYQDSKIINNATFKEKPYSIGQIERQNPLDFSQNETNQFLGHSFIPSNQLEEILSNFSGTQQNFLSASDKIQTFKENLSNTITSILQKSDLSNEQNLELSTFLTSILNNKVDSLQNKIGESSVDFTSFVKQLQEMLSEHSSDNTENIPSLPDFLSNHFLQEGLKTNLQTNFINQTFITAEQQFKLNAQIELHVRNNLNNTQETILHLNPKNLGAASIQIQWNNVDQSASLHLVLEKPQSLAAVQEALNGLKESLGQQGIKITEIKSTVDPSAGNFNFSQNDSQQGQRQEFLFNQQNKNGFNYEKTNPNTQSDITPVTMQNKNTHSNKNNLLNISV